MHYLRNKQPFIFAPLNASSLLLLMGCVVIRNNSQTPIEFDAETASYTRDENIGFRVGEIVHTPTLQTSPLNAVFSMEVADPRLQNLLSIDPETGVVTATGDFIPDYDAGDREFEIVIIASNDSQDARQTVTLRIKDINDSAPIFEPAPASANTVAENQTYSQSFKANPDAQEDGVSISYSLSGADASNFSIDPQTGVVTANAAMDYEASKKEFNFSIIATAIKTNPDGTTSVLQYNNVNLPTARQDVTLAVTNVNDNAPVIDTSITAASRPENTNISSSTVIYDAEGTYDAVPIKWSLKANNNDDAGSFNINKTTGEVTFKSDTMPDNDVKPSYSFTLVATSGAYTDEHTVTLNIIDLNETAPDITSSATPSAVNEGTAYSTGSAFYTATATYDASVIWSLKTVAGDDAGLFNINSSTGVVTFKNATTLDHESKSSYTFTVVATSPATPSDLTDEQAVTINVIDVNDVAPSITSGATATARAENTAISASTVIYTARGTHDVTPIVWSLKTGGDAALFDIDGTSGEVTFKTATTPNHEAKSSYSFTVVATSGSLTSEQVVTMNITDVNDVAPSITSGATNDIENGLSYSTSDVVYTARGTYDVTAIVWSLKAGGDASSFDIDSGTGDVTFTSQTTPNIGTKSSYSFTIIATSGSFSSERAVTINVVDSFIDKITSDVGGTIFGTSSGETIAGSDLRDFINAGAGDDIIQTNNGADGGDIIIGGYGRDTISLSEGIDQLIYRFDSTNYTAVDGADTINNFEITVDKLLLVDTASSNGVSSLTEFIDGLIAAGGSIRFTTSTVPAGSGLAGDDYINGLVITFAAAGTSDGTSAGSSTGNTLTLNFGPVGYYPTAVTNTTYIRNQLGSNYTLDSTTNSASVTAFKNTFVYYITNDQNEPTFAVTSDPTPSGYDFSLGAVFSSGASVLSVNENGSFSSETYAAAFNGTAATLTLGGADASLFSLNASGALTANAGTSFDYETKTSYQLSITASVSGAPDAVKRVVVNVINLNETAPEIAGGDSHAIAARNEGNAIAEDEILYSATATFDATVIWSITGTDAALFEINDDGDVSFVSDTSLDYSDKSSYSFNVVATSEASPNDLTDTQAVTFAVTEVAGTPNITSGSDGVTLVHGNSYTSSNIVYDANGSSGVHWRIEGQDSALFLNDYSTGRVWFKDTTTADYGTKHEYKFTMVAWDKHPSNNDAISAKQIITVKVNPFDLPTTNVSGTAGSDSLPGTSAEELIQGGDGNDIISTGGGGDTVIGGYGRDTITLGAGTDTVLVRYNSDSDGNGSLQLADGSDTINNFAFGTDTLSYYGYSTGITIDLNGTANATGYISLNTGDSYSHAFKNIENFIGTDHIDIISGNDGANILRGHAGNDRIYGFGGNDMLVGDDGDDQLYAGAGTDILIGGRGNDRIELGAGTDHVIVVFNSDANDAGQWELTDGNDTIVNFKRAEDTLFFSDETQKTGVTPITMVTGFAGDEDAPIIKAQIETSAGKKYISQLTFTFALNDGVTTVNFDATNRYEVTDESLFNADSTLTDYTMLQTIFGGENYFCMKDYDALQTSLDVI